MSDITKIANMIEEKLGYTNGWKIEDEKYSKLCLELADEIAGQIESLVIPKIAGIIQQAAKDWKVEIMTQDKDEETKICESIANDQIQQFALYDEQKITDSNFAV